MVIAERLPVIVALQIMSQDVLVELQVAEVEHKTWNILLVENKNNTFVFWKREDLLKALTLTDELDGQDLIIDSHNTHIASFDNTLFYDRFNVLSLAE